MLLYSGKNLKASPGDSVFLNKDYRQNIFAGISIRLNPNQNLDFIGIQNPPKVQISILGLAEFVIGRPPIRAEAMRLEP
jgi:hypothetical protein